MCFISLYSDRKFWNGFEKDRRNKIKIQTREQRKSSKLKFKNLFNKRRIPNGRIQDMCESDSCQIDCDVHFLKCKHFNTKQSMQRRD